MSKIDITHAHALPAEAARKAVEEMAGKLAEKFSVNSNWVGNALNFSGSGVNGLIELLPGTVRVSADLGFPVSMMKGMVEEQIKSVLQEKLG
ncbi:polyhydroxyalkanoic acid system family protein [Stenotrophomonas rhizophila]|uniref:polyhydroxyalkanoic acid system family protein n=1 Tax=Stenotrophomonas rhizophila TaxID=216778 RepID=UPI0011A93FA1|nr:polyhydroxyalkanoic acid system family protein [Stenotrophomonas rhizophila]